MVEQQIRPRSQYRDAVTDLSALLDRVAKCGFRACMHACLPVSPHGSIGTPNFEVFDALGRAGEPRTMGRFHENPLHQEGPTDLAVTGSNRSPGMKSEGYPDGQMWLCQTFNIRIR